MYASKIVEKAKSFIGVKENPPSSNDVVFNRNYYGRIVRGSAYPWCVTFIWDVFRLAGASTLFYNGQKTAYCPTLEGWGRSQGLVVGKNSGTDGDIVLYDFKGRGEATHAGIIEKNNLDGSYTTIEGNTGINSDENGGTVMRRVRNTSVIRCIIRPKYLQEPVNTTKTPNTIKEVQEYLNEKLKGNLSIDGSFGPLTNKALIMYWQSVVGSGLSVDGSFGPKSQAAASMNNLKKGDKEELVRIMQMALICRGYSLKPYGADGSFGPASETVLKSFQRYNRLSVDGICGRKTWIALLK
ncbi:peptidoglycan-binding protein [Alloiococcus sp. CFN-8]|uniref:peptidoglycan-binding protein n=1 Tax=Alloiococcus sp. CFN-8 TaxID=3416081 RepID=UPI003CE7317C